MTWPEEVVLGGRGLESDENCVWNLGTAPNEHTFMQTEISVKDAQEMDLDAVGKSEFPIPELILTTMPTCF